MTMPAPGGAGRQLFDNANTRLSTDLQADLDVGKIPVPGGEIGFATIRQGNTTISVPLDRGGALLWAQLLAQLADALSASGKLAVAPPGSIVPAVAGQHG